MIELQAGNRPRRTRVRPECTLAPPTGTRRDCDHASLSYAAIVVGDRAAGTLGGDVTLTQQHSGPRVEHAPVNYHLLTVLFTVIVSVYKLFITNYLPFPCLYEISVNENRMVGALYNTIHLVTLGSTRGGTTTVCVFQGTLNNLPKCPTCQLLINPENALNRIVQRSVGNVLIRCQVHPHLLLRRAGAKDKVPVIWHARNTGGDADRQINWGVLGPVICDIRVVRALQALPLRR